MYHINRIKDKKCIIISITQKTKTFHKVQHAFIIKTLNTLAIEGNFLTLIKDTKAHYW
jgi:hypothetical protein